MKLNFPSVPVCIVVFQTKNGEASESKKAREGNERKKMPKKKEQNCKRMHERKGEKRLKQQAKERVHYKKV